MISYFRIRMISSKIIIVIIFIIIITVILTWLFVESSKPLPGTKITDLGRGHVPIGEQVDYNSNPPTSGKHYEEWIRAGVYSQSKDDRNLVHSLEHGYIILSAKCKVQNARLEEMSTEASESGKFEVDDECKQRLDQLANIYEKKGKRKLIVVPRENLDTNFALTAWNYLDKFDEFDAKRIEKFIDAHRDHGPEKTME